MPHNTTPPGAPSLGNTPPTGAMAHGIIIAELFDGNDGPTVVPLVAGMSTGSLTVTTASQMEGSDRQHPNGDTNIRGTVVVAFVNSTQPIRDATAHQEMQTLAAKIEALAPRAGHKYFKPNPEHYGCFGDQ